MKYLRVKGSRPTKRGFTLIEVLAATFAALICASVVLATMPVANTSRAKASNGSKALNLAQKQLEAIRGVGYSNITVNNLMSVGLIDGINPAVPNLYSFSNTDVKYLDSPYTVLTAGRGSVRITNTAPNMKEIIVTVSWRERSKRRNVVLGSMVADL